MLLDRVKKISKKLGLTLPEVARKAGIGENSIYAWKTREPSIATIKKVADVLNVSTDYLLDRTNDASINNGNNDFDEDIVTMARKVQNASPEERKKGLEILRTLFDE